MRRYSIIFTIFNYLYHSAKIQNKEIREAFEDFSRNELEHARMLIGYILKKEETPVFIMPEVNQEQDAIKLLVLSMAAEESAVKKYTMIQQLIDDPSDKEMFGKTIGVERQHYEILKGIMEKLKEAYRKKEG